MKYMNQTLFVEGVRCDTNCNIMEEASNYNIRTEERLKVKIAEAKYLISRNSNSAPERDIYCALSLDQEEIFRTSTIGKSLNPFFGEEFQFEVPRAFRYLCVYIYDGEKQSKDRLLGKVAIKREDLHAFHNKDHWFPIRPITRDSEVQGKLHVDLKFERNALLEVKDKLSLNVFEACDLTLVNGNCDAYLEILLKYTDGRQDVYKTKIKKKTNCPIFNESFNFTLPKDDKSKDKNNYRVDDVDWSEIVMTMYHEISSGNSVFIGEVKLSLLGVQQQMHAAADAWYYLQPRKKRTQVRVPASSLSSAVIDDNCLGTLRMKIQYFVDHILPSSKYTALRELVLRSWNVQPVTSSAVYLLGEIIPSKVEVAHCLVKILMHENQVASTMRSLAIWEISKVTDVNTIFRGNTLVSKLMDEVMRLVGLRYLHETLRPSLERILQERKPCEIDPSRVKDCALIRQNLSNLKVYVEDIFLAITTSALHCPSLMSQLFHDLREIAILFFPDNKEIRYSVVSGFIFLRFFAPAILGPRLFELTNEQIDAQTHRTLTLISKTIQSLGNLVCSKNGPCKEEYMSSMYKTFYNDTHTTAVRQFLEIISTSSTRHTLTDQSLVLKEGIMTKRAQGRRRFGRKNFKQRYFTLTSSALSYSKSKGKDSLCEIPLRNILAVEKVSKDSFKRSNMFQIIQSQSILYIQANNCVDEKGWIETLRRLCCFNDKQLAMYHTSSFSHGQWMCCKNVNENSVGCTKVTERNNAINTSDVDVDVDRELSRLQTLTIMNMDRLENVISACECQTVYPDEKYVPKSVIEDVESCYGTLSAIKDAVRMIELEQRNILRALTRDIQYGSKQAPIGDDNYLLLAGRSDAVLRKQY